MSSDLSREAAMAAFAKSWRRVLINAADRSAAFMSHSHRLSKKLHSLLDGYGPEIATADPRPSRCASLLHADAPPQVTQGGEMIEFLAQMPTDTMIFITTVFLGLAATLIGLKWLI
jgi:kynureninase